MQQSHLEYVISRDTGAVSGYVRRLHSLGADFPCNLTRTSSAARLAATNRVRFSMGQSFESSDKRLLVSKSIAQPWECDVMGHMTTRFYVAKFDDASYHFLYQVFGWSISDRESQGFGWADVRHVIDYKAEVSAGDLLEIHARLRKVGDKSFTAVYEMTDCASGELAATLEAVCVHFDLNARRAIPIPNVMRTHAAEFLQA